jgi:hypothetical protein
MTQVALKTHKKELIHETPTFAKQKFLYRLSRSDYEKEWGNTYTKTGLGTRILATLFRYLPKVGPLKGMGFNNPTPQTEDLYIMSINTTTDQYRALLEEVRAGKLILPNRDLDSGEVTKAAEYSLADESYAVLLAKLSANKFNLTSPQLRNNILDFYFDLSVPIGTRKDESHWHEVLADLDQLKSAPLPPPVAVNPAH